MIGGGLLSSVNVKGNRLVIATIDHHCPAEASYAESGYCTSIPCEFGVYAIEAQCEFTRPEILYLVRDYNFKPVVFTIYRHKYITERERVHLFGLWADG